MTKEQEKFVKDWSISDYQIIEDNLTVGGYLDLRGTSIKTLPDNLTVGGDLYLYSLKMMFMLMVIQLSMLIMTGYSKPRIEM
jgi:hypothetical protein